MNPPTCEECADADRVGYRSAYRRWLCDACYDTYLVGPGYDHRPRR